MPEAEHQRCIERVARLASAVRESGPIGLDGLIDELVTDPLLAHSLSMLVDGLPIEDVRRHLGRCVAAERARQEERFAVVAATLDLVAAGEQASYIRFTFDGITRG